jgi:hypothetical protein
MRKSRNPYTGRMILSHGLENPVTSVQGERDMRPRNSGILIGLGAFAIVAVLLVLQIMNSNGTRVNTITGTSTIANSDDSESNSGALFNVTFYEAAACGGSGYLTEWGVMLGNRTMTEPTNITLSDIPEDGSGRVNTSFNSTTITFAVPSGVYPFTLYPTVISQIGSPNGVELGGPTGWVTVTNSDVKIYTHTSEQICVVT